MEDRLAIYNFCREYIRLCDLHHNLFDLNLLSDENEKLIFDELDTIEDCLYDMIELKGRIDEFEGD